MERREESEEDISEDSTKGEIEKDGDVLHEDEEEICNLMQGSSREAGRDTSNELSPKEMNVFTKMHSVKKKYTGEGRPDESVEMLTFNQNEEGRQAAFLPAPLAEDECTDLHEVEVIVGDLPAAAVADVESGASDNAGTTEQEAKPKQLQLLQNAFFTVCDRKSPLRSAVFIIIVAAVLGLLIFVSILPESFVDVEYYELALTRSRISGKVNRDRTLYPGCYLLTPDTELIRFDGTAHFLDLTLSVSTSDRLSFSLNVSLQYFIKPEELGALHSDYDDSYRDVVEAVTTSTIKNEAVKFSLDEYRLNRSFVEEKFRSAVFVRLGGNCCPSHCVQGFDCQACILPPCNYGMHMEMRHFQMGALDIPHDVAERFLRQAILLVESEKELFLQEHSVETKRTEQMSQNILNKGAELRENSTAYSSIIRAAANAEFEKKVQVSYVQALKEIYSQLNFTKEDHKLSLMFIRALEDMPDRVYNLNFEKCTYMTGPKPSL